MAWRRKEEEQKRRPCRTEQCASAQSELLRQGQSFRAGRSLRKEGATGLCTCPKKLQHDPTKIPTLLEKVRDDATEGFDDYSPCEGFRKAGAGR